jgi:gliding motility-associated-like protein
VRWLKPLVGGLGKLDTVQYPGPYVFELRRFEQGNSNDLGTVIYSVSKPYFKSIKSLTDTTFTDQGINTRDKGYQYQVDFYVTPSKTVLGNSGKAQSIFLKLKGNNQKLVLSWNERLSPWKADTSYIYQRNVLGQFVLIGKKLVNIDTVLNLVNGQDYCFKVINRGKFNDEGIVYSNLYDSSQVACEKPNDLSAPCNVGNLSLSADCENSELVIKYDFPSVLGCDTSDVVKFKIWRSNTDTGKFVLIDSILGKSKRYSFQNSESLAGCYAVTAVDSSGNESTIKDKICIDNCDFLFELPNIFTPNKDTINDLYTPVKKEVRFVNKLDFKIYNRWGLLVYETNDILINWNGNIKNSAQKCPDGVYFYVGSATIARLKGDEIKKFTGYIHLQRSGN